MPYTFVNGINIYYEIEGEGFPLVLIPGMGSNLDVWAPQFRHGLSQNNLLLLMDPRGTGRSDAPDMEYSVEMMARDISELMDKVGIARAHVMGLSLGAMIGQELAISYSSKVEKLILCATHCGVKHYIPFSNPASKKSSNDATDAYEDSIVNRMYPPDFIKNNPDKIRDIVVRETGYPLPAPIFEHIYQAARRFDTYDRLDQIKAPTLVMCGDADQMVNPENSRMLAELISGAFLKIIPGGGHGFIEQFPELVLDIVADFLK